MPSAVGFLSMPVVILLTVWSLFWKSLALWKAARRRQLVWYIVLLVISTAGILPIIYAFVIAPRQSER